MRNHEDSGFGKVAPYQSFCSGIVDDKCPGGFRDPPEHWKFKIPFVARRAGSSRPEVSRKLTRPVAVIENEFFDVFRTIQEAKIEMVEHGIVQYDNAGFLYGSTEDPGVQLIVSEVIQV